MGEIKYISPRNMPLVCFELDCVWLIGELLVRFLRGDYAVKSGDFWSHTNYLSPPPLLSSEPQLSCPDWSASLFTHLRRPALLATQVQFDGTDMPQ